MHEIFYLTQFILLNVPERIELHKKNLIFVCYHLMIGLVTKLILKRSSCVRGMYNLSEPLQKKYNACCWLNQRYTPFYNASIVWSYQLVAEGRQYVLDNFFGTERYQATSFLRWFLISPKLEIV